MPRKEYSHYYLEDGREFPPSGYGVYNEKGPNPPVSPTEALVRQFEEKGYSPEAAKDQVAIIMKERMTPEKQAQMEKFKQAVDKTTPDLSQRELYVLDRRYGLDGNIPFTQARIGKEIGCSPQQVGRIEKKALAKVRPHYFPHELIEPK